MARGVLVVDFEEVVVDGSLAYLSECEGEVAP